jgi:DNA-binding transcriptional MerR regulator
MRSAEVSKKAIKKYVDLFNEGEHTVSERKNILIKQREKIADKISAMQEVLNEIIYFPRP